MKKLSTSPVFGPLSSLPVRWRPGATRGPAKELEPPGGADGVVPEGTARSTQVRCGTGKKGLTLTKFEAGTAVEKLPPASTAIPVRMVSWLEAPK